jgi:uncharacterized ParB-like nuclease family protein
MIRFRTALAVCALALTMGLAASAAASGPIATASKSCHLTLSQQRHAGATYLIALSVTKVSCSTGLSVEKAFQSCRRATAGHRTCKKRVSGYKCTQSVLDSSKTQYDAKVKCTAGSRAVSFTYTQNT